MTAAVPLLLKLLTAHLAGDYLIQDSRTAARKLEPAPLALHAAGHAVLLLLVGLSEPGSPALWLALLLVLVAHAGIDAWTSRLAPRDLRLLALDQALHLATLVVAVAIARPAEAAELGRALAAAAATRSVWIVVAGGLLAVPAGAPVIGRGVKPLRDSLSNESTAQRVGLEFAGRWIGMAERLVIYVAVLAGLQALIGIVVGAKAVIRLPEARDKWSRELAEYYLVGSLASLAWALLTGLAVRGMLRGGS